MSESNSGTPLNGEGENLKVEMLWLERSQL